MSRLCRLLLLTVLLICIQAAPKPEENVVLGHTTSHSITKANRTKTQHKNSTAKQHHLVQSAKMLAKDEAVHPQTVTVDPKIFNKRRFVSSRVMFSAHPPLMTADLELMEYSDSEDIINQSARIKRGLPDLHPVHRLGEVAVCDSTDVWVGNKTKATDIKGNEVTVLEQVNINNSVLRQYFFETRCSNYKPTSTGCRGIDAKHWNSYCTTTHTYVRALTMENEHASWRFIRIDAACVCVLSRKTWKP
ncbi:beta-nerve growth factor [Protopterus annectens]|nr:beta-nerve growth factor [Protopterus annectens]XP_043932374.1 beta-nerve growth factor [Protopterus annectens]XP_043932375.1 beta-nerve growth factor [Protopterus annectens]